MKEKANILLVEDNEGDIRLIQESFRSIIDCCNFVVAKDGQEALDYLLNIEKENYRGLPDFILLDINLPKISGLELLEEIKGDGMMSMVPTIIFSSSSAEKDIRAAYRHHANSYIVKPDDIGKYEETLRRVWEYWSDTVKLPLHT